MADDINARLNSILSDPQALSRIMTLASGLMSSDEGAARSRSPEPEFEAVPDLSEPSESSPPGLGAAQPAGAFSGLGQSREDHRCELLRALKPYLRKSRAGKLDMMISLLQVTQLARSTLRSYLPR